MAEEKSPARISLRLFATSRSEMRIMMSNLFSMDNLFFRFMSRVADALILNFFFLITSIPVVTMGASYTAMYYYCTKAVANEEGYLWKSYWKSFKLNFKQGFFMELIFGIAALIIYVDIKYLYQVAIVGDSFAWKLVFFIVIGIAILIAITFMYAFPILARFDNKTFQIIKNAVFMSLKHFSTTVPLILIALLCILIGWIMFPTSLLFIVGAWVYLSSILIYRVLDRYMPKDEHYEEDYYLGAKPEEAVEEEYVEPRVIRPDMFANNSVSEEDADVNDVKAQDEEKQEV